MRKSTVLLMLAAGPLTAQQGDVGRFADSLFRATYAADAPGAAVVIFDDNRVVHRGTHGLANLETRAAITEATSFYLASVSKPFTALAIHALIAENRLRASDRLVTLIPELRGLDSSITVEHLLTHSAGLVDFYSLIDWPKFRYLDNAGVLDSVAAHPASRFPPGSKYEYSNTGYVLLSIVAQRAMRGRPLGAILGDRVFKPLGMRAVVYDDTARQVNGRAIGYYNASGKWLLSDLDALGLPDGRIIRYHFVQTGQGGVFASIDDLAKFGQALLGTTLLDSASRRVLWNVHLRTPAQPGIDTVQGVARGWFVSRRNGHRIIWHDGNRGGAKAIIALAPDRNFGMAIVSNREDSDVLRLATLLIDRGLR